MVKFKAIPNNNVHIPDINIKLNAHVNNWVEVPDEVFANSIDVQKMRHLLIVDGVDENIVTPKATQTMFVAQPNVTESIPENIFVATPEPTVIVPELEVVSEQPKVEEVMESPVEEIRVEETKEVVEEIIEEVKTEEKSSKPKSKNSK